MGRVIKVDCDYLLEIDKDFDSQATEISKIDEELKTQFESIHDCWQGIDADNFIKNSEKLIRVLVKEANHQVKWSDYIKHTTMRYGNNVQEGLVNLRNQTKD